MNVETVLQFHDCSSYDYSHQCTFRFCCVVMTMFLNAQFAFPVFNIGMIEIHLVHIVTIAVITGFT